MKNWVVKHKRASIAIMGCVILWSGIVMIAGLPITLIATGALMLLGVFVSMLPDDADLYRS